MRSHFPGRQALAKGPLMRVHPRRGLLAGRVTCIFNMYAGGPKASGALGTLLWGQYLRAE